MSLSPFGTSWFGRDDARDTRRSIVGGLDGEHLLVPLLNPEVPAITDQIKVARTLAREQDASLELLKPVDLPGSMPSDTGETVTDSADRELLEWALEEATVEDTRPTGTVLYNRRLVKGILEAVRSKGADTLVLPRDSSRTLLRRNATERLAAQADCEVVVVNGRPRYDSVSSVLLPVAGGPHSGLATDVAGTFAAAHDAWVDVLHVLEADHSDQELEQAQAYVDAAYERLARPETTSKRIHVTDDARADAIVEQSGYYDLTVLGAPTAGRLHRFVHGSCNRAVRAEARSLVLSTRNHDPSRSLMDEWYRAPLDDG